MISNGSLVRCSITSGVLDELRRRLGPRRDPALELLRTPAPQPTVSQSVPRPSRRPIPPAEQTGRERENTHETPPGMNSAFGKGAPSAAVMLNAAKNCAIMSQLESSEKYLPGHTLRGNQRQRPVRIRGRHSETHRRPKPKTKRLGSFVLQSNVPSSRRNRSGLYVSGSG